MQNVRAQQPTCYGAMFPDSSRLQVNAPCQGKVFSATLESIGIGVQSSCVDLDAAQWNRCVA